MTFLSYSLRQRRSGLVFFLREWPKLGASSYVATLYFQGDSGGPLVRKKENGRWEQVGIVSFGSTNCEEGAPDGFTQVNLFLEWIEQQTGIIPPRATSKKAEQ